MKTPWNEIEDGAVVLCPDGSVCVKWAGKGICVRNGRGPRFESPGCWVEHLAWPWDEETSYPEAEVLDNIGEDVKQADLVRRTAQGLG